VRIEQDILVHSIDEIPNQKFHILDINLAFYIVFVSFVEWKRFSVKFFMFFDERIPYFRPRNDIF